MFQTFTETASADTGPARLQALRAAMAGADVDGFLIPRSDAFQGEYVAPCDERLAWLTGFTGSAGWGVALAERAAVFVDGRYRVQVKAQVADVFEPVDWPEISLGDWISAAMPDGVMGFDPWLLTVEQKRGLDKKGIALRPVPNLVDAIWEDRPAPPMGKVFAQPVALSGEAHVDKITRLAGGLGKARAAVVTLPDSIAWLLNIRGSDIPKNPVPHGFAILHADARVTLFMADEKLSDVRDHLGDAVTVEPVEAFEEALRALQGPVRIEPGTCPVAVVDALEGREIIEADDPCVLPKARKNTVELEGSRAAHLRDAAAMVRFLAWLDREAPGDLSEIAVVKQLEEERRATNALRDISFDTISGSGPNGAIVHYRVTEATDRPLKAGELLLVDSGGQYVDGTTDITRTVSIGEVGEEEKRNFTLVLKGMIAISRLRFPKGMAGRDIDPFARHALWQAGLDYGHGTGHGVGSYLCVHEGPARISRAGTVPFEPGMILSNEPGFYREGAYGIRIENLVVVEEAPTLPGQTIAQQYRFETLTWVPIDRRLIVPDMLTMEERDWLNAYHREVEAKVAPLVDDVAGGWLSDACRGI
ncbi:aminopeptidase P family protein [Pacificoceanicola onchidii]|uniref:aminopeptidase P family protein n=1 Tax=Pacificoceanicola onchidii TaxID=2562685 RepID=UPI0010A56B5F|nr:aminopeptidase P family protein [Pacificoceanicola onchidii]